MKEHGSAIRRRGLLLLIENVKPIVYRSLFRKIKTIYGKTQIKLELFIDCLKSLGVEMEIEQLQCLLSNLIYKDLIKAYLKYPENYIIFSSGNPFPSLLDDEESDD